MNHLAFPERPSSAGQPARRPRVIIVGAGLVGLGAARKLADAPVDVLILNLNRTNYHVFAPLLYQVATAGLEP